MAKLAGATSCRPVGHALDVESVEAWVAVADPGQRLVYAWGRVPPRERAAWARARELSSEGEVRLHDRLRGDGDREWFMVKRELPAGAPAPVSNRTDPAPETEEEAVLRILRRHVRLKLACPTNAEIGRQVGLTATQVAYRVRVLREWKAIHLDDRGPGWRRMLTIDGRTTPAAVL
jgi:hypothetical protein